MSGLFEVGKYWPKSVLVQLLKKFKGPRFYRDWAQKLQTFRLPIIISKLSVIGIFDIIAILS